MQTSASIPAADAHQFAKFSSKQARPSCVLKEEEVSFVLQIFSLNFPSKDEFRTMSKPAKEKSEGKQQQYQRQHQHMFWDGFEERRDLEQYVWTRKTVDDLAKALRFESQQLCCLATPSIAQNFYVREGNAVRLLDIDTRFSYLPGFRYWDIRKPSPIPGNEDYRIVVFDPPFFYIPMEELRRAVLEVCKKNVTTKLMIGFLIREEAALLTSFKDFNLVRTKFTLEYATVKPNKWRNYALYSNVDLPGIKRIQKTTMQSSYTRRDEMRTLIDSI